MEGRVPNRGRSQSHILRNATPVKDMDKVVSSLVVVGDLGVPLWDHRHNQVAQPNLICLSQ